MPVCRILNRQGQELRRFATESAAVGTSFSVGRSSSCTIALKQEAGRTVSRVHFTVEQQPSGAWVLANKSSHGTLKGDRSIEQAPIEPGDVFQFGSCFFCFGDQAGPSPYRLRWEEDGGGQDEAVLWPGRNTVGDANNNTIAVKSESVSRQHARITISEGEVYIEDLNSSLGTFIGGKKVDGLVRVAPGAQIRLGKARVWLEEPARSGAGGAGGEAAAAGHSKGLMVAAAVVVVVVLAAIILGLMR